MFDPKKVEGQYPPIVTPCDRDGNLDEAGLKSVIQYMLEGGVHGIFAMGSCGEHPSYTREQRRRVVEICAGEIGGKVPLMVGVHTNCLADTIALTKEAQGLGADMAVATPPWYFAHGQAELIDYYRRLTEATEFPMFLYHIPGVGKGNGFTPDTLKQLAQNPYIIGVKDSSTSFHNTKEFIKATKDIPDFKVFQGMDSLTGVTVLYGGHGAVNGLSNVAPKLLNEVYAAAKAGDLERLRDLDEKVMTLIGIYFAGPAGIAQVKTAMDLLGVCGPYTFSPMMVPGAEVREKVKSILVELGMLG